MCEPTEPTEPKCAFVNVFCIDKRYDVLTTQYYNYKGFNERTKNYYLITTAGSSLCLGYSGICTQVCTPNCKTCTAPPCTAPPCDPLNPDMQLLKKSLVKNIDIALSLDPHCEYYLLNHQDCGAMKAYISCTGYPTTLGSDNELEIRINEQVLTFAAQYIKNRYPETHVRLGLIDTNGTVCDFNPKFRTWVLQYVGPGVDPRGLWFGVENLTPK